MLQFWYKTQKNSKIFYLSTVYEVDKVVRIKLCFFILNTVVNILVPLQICKIRSVYYGIYV